jgi:5-methylcytosine-specific restriction endonuclease McrBC GTP-binding regulatory subunit McrB
VIESSDSKIYMIEAASFNLLIRQKKAQMFVLSLREINAQIYSISQANIDIQLSKIERISIDSRTLISFEYHDFLNVFFKKEVDKLSSHRENYDHRIELKEKKVDHEYASLY